MQLSTGDHPGDVVQLWEADTRSLLWYEKQVILKEIWCFDSVLRVALYLPIKVWIWIAHGRQMCPLVTASPLSSPQTSWGLLVNVNTQSGVFIPESRGAVSLSLQDMLVRAIMTFLNDYNSTGKGRAHLDKVWGTHAEVMIHLTHVFTQNSLSDLALCHIELSLNLPARYHESFSAKSIHCSVFMFDWSLTAESLPSLPPEQPHRKQAA